MNAPQIAAFVAGSRAVQGLPRHVEDEAVLIVVAGRLLATLDMATPRVRTPGRQDRSACRREGHHDRSG